VVSRLLAGPGRTGWWLLLDDLPELAGWADEGCRRRSPGQPV